MSSGDSAPEIHVVVGVVIDGEGKRLIAQRPAGKHLAGGWEFPGGKLEAGEERRAGLARELREELGITVHTARPLIRVRHTYPYGDVLLDVWVVRHYEGEPSGLDGQALRWCTQEELEAVELLPADGPIVRALRLPETLSHVQTVSYLIQDCARMGQTVDHGRGAHDDVGLRGAMCAGVSDAVNAAASGADFVVLRDLLEEKELVHLCGLVSVPVFGRGFSLERVWELGASGVNEIA